MNIRYFANISNNDRTIPVSLIAKNCQEDELVAVIRQVYRQADPGQAFRKISIEKLNDNRIVYQINEEDQRPIELDADQNDQIHIELRRVNLAGGRIQRRSYHEIQSEILRSCPSKVSLIAWVWRHFLTPIGAFFSLLQEKMLSDTTIHQRELYRTLMTENGQSPEAQRFALRRVVELLEDGFEEGDLQARQLAGIMRESSDIYESVLDAAAARAGMREIAETLSQRIRERAVAALADNPDDHKPLYLVPSGYYQDGTYNPFFLSFTMKEGHICIQKLSWKDESLQKSEPVEYLLGINDHTQSRLKGILTNALSLYHSGDLEAPEHIHEDEDRRMEMIHWFGRLGNEGRQVNIAPVNPESYLEQIILSNGAQAVNVAPLKVRGIGTSWGQMQACVDALYPNFTKEKKLNWLIATFHKELDHCLSSYERYSLEEKHLSLKRLREKMIKLEEHLNKAFENEEAFEKLTAHDGAFDDLRHRLDALERACEGQKAEERQGHARLVDKALRANPNSAEAVVLPEYAFQVNLHGGAGAVQDNPMIRFKPQIATLRDAFAANDLALARTTFEALTSEANRLVERGKYHEALRLSTKVMLLLPSPKLGGHAEGNFWDAIAGNYEEIDLWGKNIAELTKYQWEASLKSGSQHLWPDTFLALATGRTCLVKLIRLKSLAIRRDLGIDPNIHPDRLNLNLYADQLEEMGRQRKEILTLSFDKFQSDYREILETFNFHPHFRFAADPDMDKKVKELEEYLTGVGPDSGKGAFEGNVLRFDAQVEMHREEENNYRTYEAYCGQIIVPGVRDSRFSTIQRRENTSLPPEIVDLRRHEVMFRCMMYPESSIVQHFEAGLRGEIDAINYLNSRNQEAAKLVRDKSEIAKKTGELCLKDLQDKIPLMGRLELSTSTWVVNSTPTITIVGSRAFSPVFAYLPHGFGLPQEFASRLSIVRIGNNAKEVVGNVDPKWLEEGLDAHDGEQARIRPALNNWDEIHRNNTIVNPRPLMTEVGMLRNAAQELGKNTAHELVMRSLEAYMDNQAGNSKELSLRNLISALDVIRNYPYLLTEESVQFRLELVLYRPHLIQRLFRENPEALIAFGYDLREVIQEKISLGRSREVGFLLSLANTLDRHARRAREENPSREIDQFLQIVPKPSSDFIVGTFEHEGEIVEQRKTGLQLLAEWSISPGKDQPAAYLRLLEFFSSKDLNNLTADEAASLLAAKTQVPLAAVQMKMPMDQNRLDEWLEEDFTPAVAERFQADGEFCNQTLNALLKQKMNIDQNNPWSPARRGAPWIYQCERFKIDLRTGKVDSIQRNVPVPSVRTALPVEISSSHLFKKFFADATIYANVELGKTPGSLLFRFNVDGIDYKIHFDKTNRDVILERLVRAEENRSGRQQWYRYQSLSKLEGNGIAPLLEEYGLWMRTDKPRDALLVTTKSLEWLPDDILSLEIDRNRKITGARTLDGGTVKLDSDGHFEGALKAIHNSQLLFIQKSWFGGVDEIRVVGSGITLKKEDGVWKSHGRVSNCAWLTDYSQAPIGLAAKHRRDALLDLFGDEFADTILPLVNGKEEKLLIWPHSLNRNGKIVKEKDAGKAAEISPMVISIDSKGRLQASAAALLYVAYLQAKKKNYSEALFFLKEAEKAPLASQSDIKMFDRMTKILRQNISPSARSLAFHLKAELAMKRIQSTQLGRQQLDPNNPESYLTDALHLSDLVEQLSSRMQEAPRAFLINHDLELTEEERNALANIQNEAMVFYLKKYAAEFEQGHIDVEPPKKLKGVSLADNSVPPPDFVATLFALSKPPVPEEELLSIERLNGREILEHFVSYWNLILERDLGPQDLPFLWNPIEAEWVEELGVKESQFLTQADYARKTLLALASTKGDREFLERIDQTRLLALKSMLPAAPRTSIPYIATATAIYDMLPRPELDLQEIWRKRGHLVNDLREIWYHRGNIVRGYFGGIHLRALKFSNTFDKGREAVACLAQPLNALQNRQRYANDMILTADGFAPAPVQQRDSNNKKDKIDYAVTVEAIEAVFMQNTEVFSPQERRIIRETLNGVKPTDRDVPKSLMTICSIASSMGAPLITLRREAVLEDRIRKLETILNAPPLQPAAPIRNGEVDAAVLNAPVSPLLAACPRRPWDALKDDVLPYFERGNTPAEEEENRKIVASLNEAARQLNEEDASSYTIQTMQQLNGVKAALEAQLSHAQGSAVALRDDYRSQILNWVRGEECNIARLKGMLTKPALYSEEDIIDKVLDYYQMSSKCHLVDPLADAITSYLLLETKIQQYQAALGQLHKLKDLLAIRRPDAIVADQKQELGRQIGTLIWNGERTSRYFVEGAAHFDNPALSRKFLVAEVRMEKILRPGQRVIAKEIHDNSNILRMLRMGLGKTTIFPLIATILSEKGEHPFLIVPEELRDINHVDFDAASRLISSKAAFRFDSSVDDSVEPAYLQEKYYQLLIAKKERGYCVGTIQALVNVKNVLTNLAETRRKKLEALGNREQTSSEALELINLQRKIFWMGKIDAALNSMQYFGDEIDDVLAVNNEVNRGVGEKRNPDKIVREVSRCIFDLILGYNGDDQDLKELRKHLRHGTQADHTEHMPRYMDALARALVANPAWIATALNGRLGVELLPGVDREELCAYLRGTQETLPENMPQWQNHLNGNDPEHIQQCVLAATKRLLSVTIPNSLVQTPGNKVGISKEDGYSVVPKKGRKEDPGTRFGQEHEMIFNAYLGWAQYRQCQSIGGASDAFILRSLTVMEEREPQRFEEIANAMQADRRGQQPIADLQKKKEAMLVYLKKPKAYKHRLDLLDRMVFDAGFIKIFSEQICFNVQNALEGRKYGGVTGTLNERALPPLDHAEEAQNQFSRVVEAETILREIVNAPQGARTPVNHFPDHGGLQRVEEILADPNATAILNGGGYGMEGLSTEEWVQKIRRGANGSQRDILFIGERAQVEGEGNHQKVKIVRVQLLWKAGQQDPRPYEPGEHTNKLVCVYGPSDTRGVDLPIPPGKVYDFPDASDNLESDGQRKWRARGLGNRHQIMIELPESMYQRILRETGKEHVDYVDCFNDTKKKSLEPQMGIDLKAQIRQVEGFTYTGVRELLFKPDPAMEDPDYWNLEDQRCIGRIFADLFYQNELYKKLRPRLIQEKKIHFESDYSPTRMIAGVDKIQDVYETEKERLQKLKDEVFVEVFDQLDRQLKNHFDVRFCQIAQPFIQEIFKRSVDQNQTIREAAINFGAANPLIQPWISQIPKEVVDSLEKYRALFVTVNRLLHDLEAHSASFREKVNEHAKFLPPSVPEGTAGEGNVHARVQEQQMQQQRQHQTVDASGKADDRDRRNVFTRFPVGNLLNPNRYRTMMFPIGQIFPEIRADIYVTPEAYKLYLLHKPFRGEPLFRLAFVDGNAFLLSQLDYHHIVGPALERARQGIGELAEAEAAVYALKPSGLSLIERGLIQPDLDEAKLLKTAQARFILGYSTMPDNEKETFRNWMTNTLNEADRQHLHQWTRDHGDFGPQSDLLLELEGRV